MNDSQEPTMEIRAPSFEVRSLLEATLSESELAVLTVRYEPIQQDPLMPERQGDYETVRAVIEFLAGATASGIAYDILKKLGKAAVGRFGKENVKEG